MQYIFSIMFKSEFYFKMKYIKSVLNARRKHLNGFHINFYIDRTVATNSVTKQRRLYTISWWLIVIRISFRSGYLKATRKQFFSACISFHTNPTSNNNSNILFLIQTINDYRHKEIWLKDIITHSIWIRPTVLKTVAYLWSILFWFSFFQQYFQFFRDFSVNSQFFSRQQLIFNLFTYYIYHFSYTLSCHFFRIPFFLPNQFHLQRHDFLVFPQCFIFCK